MSKDAVNLLVITSVLLAIGLVMLFSASAIYAGEGKVGDYTLFLKKQLVWITISVVGLFIASKIHYSYWIKARYPILAITIISLLLVLIPGVAPKINGARRWFRFSDLSFQPSEMAKLAMVIFLSASISLNPDRIKNFKHGFLPLFAVVSFISALILVEPDIGTASFILMVSSLILIVGGVKLNNILPLAAGAFVLTGTVALFAMPHFKDRIMVFLDPSRDPLGKGYNINQSFIALGSGGWFGVGLGKGISKLFFLPEVHSDFIFPVIGEELGFIGSIVIMGLFAYLLYIGYRIMQKTSDRFSFLLAFGIIFFIILQAAMNIAVVTGAIPAKGIPLPFISFGGSSLLFIMFGLGILVNIANNSHQKIYNAG